MSAKKEESTKAPSTAVAVHRMKISVVWLVPLIAAAAAGYLVYDRLSNMGPDIKIMFTDGQGLQAGQTAVRYRGVRIGVVRSVSLTADAQNVEAGVELDKSARSMAQEGAMFWVVRPEVSAGSLRGLETLVSGAYIQVQPGTGKEQKKFTGLEHAPMIPSTKGGLEISLIAPELGSLTVGAPVYFRGMEVGSVEFYSLNEDSTAVKVRVRIDGRYAPLITAETKFWNAGGINVSLKFFGINVSAESVKSLLSGGIAFATPPTPAAAAAAGSVFPLNEKADEKWLKWIAPHPGWEQTAKTPEAGQ